MASLVKAFLDFLDNRAIFRRGILIATFIMTWEAVKAAWVFASMSTFDGIGTAAVIGAVTAPLSAIQIFAFQQYSGTRKRTSD